MAHNASISRQLPPGHLKETHLSLPLSCLYFRIKQQSSNIFSDVFMLNIEAVTVITEQVDNYNILD
jgi:hypothetical protein